MSMIDRRAFVASCFAATAVGCSGANQKSVAGDPVTRTATCSGPPVTPPAGVSFLTPPGCWTQMGKTLVYVVPPS
jgi:hypothetical protein